MKTIHLIPALSIAFLFSCTEAEQDQTPDGVLKSFGTMYPNATEIEWEHEQGVWEAEFTDNDHVMSAEFSQTDGWIETETALHRSEVPAPVVDGIYKKYPNAEFLKFEEVRGENFMAYEVNIRFEEKEIEILISGSGDILEGKKESGSEENLNENEAR